jgi:hypothetical protein
MYYAHRLTICRRWNAAFEIILAFGTSGTIGTWAIWKTGAGGYAWLIIAAVTALVADVLKPIFRFPQKIAKYSQLYVYHTTLYYDLRKLVFEIQRTRDFTTQMTRIAESFESALERDKRFATGGDPNPNERLPRKFFEEVHREIPADRLWMPPTPTAPQTKELSHA